MYYIMSPRSSCCRRLPRAPALPFGPRARYVRSSGEFSALRRPRVRVLRRAHGYAARPFPFDRARRPNMRPQPLAPSARPARLPCDRFRDARVRNRLRGGQDDARLAQAAPALERAMHAWHVRRTGAARAAPRVRLERSLKRQAATAPGRPTRIRPERRATLRCVVHKRALRPEDRRYA